MANTIQPHAHCIMCAKPVDLGETLCSDDCKQKYNTMLKKRRTMMYIMYGFIAVLVAVIVFSSSI